MIPNRNSAPNVLIETDACVRATEPTEGRTAVLREEPQESPRSLAPSLPASGKVSTAAERSVAATAASDWTDGETMSTFRRQPPSGNGVSKLLGSIWRYKSLIAVAVLLGALLGSGWAARQPTLYEGVTRVVLVAGSDRTALPGEALYPPGEPEGHLHRQAQVMSSSPVLARAVKQSGSRISVETLRQRLEIDAAAEADVLTIRVVDSTATGAARLADAVAVAYDQFLAQQLRATSLQMVRQLQNTQSPLKARLAEIDAKLAGRPDNPVLRAQRDALAQQLSAVRSALMQAEASAGRNHPLLLRERAAVPKQPVSPSPGRAMVIGMLLGLLASAVLVWWRTRGQRPTSSSSAPEQGPEMPRA